MTDSETPSLRDKVLEGHERILDGLISGRLNASGAAVHDTITEALRAHRWDCGRRDCACEQWRQGDYYEHVSAAVQAALEAADLPVLKRVEPHPPSLAPISRELVEEAENDPANHALRKHLDDAFKAALETPLELP